MATQTMTTADAILKEFYVGPIVEQLNQKTFLLDQIDRDSDHVDATGRRSIVPVHTGRNRGRNSIGDGGTLAVAGKQSYADAVVLHRYHNAGIELTDLLVQATKRNEGAFIRAMEAETKGVAQDLKKDINRQAFGEGTGALTTIRANSSSTTVNVTSVQNLQIGDVIDVLVAATGATTNGVSGATVTARDTTAGAQTVTVDTALAGTAGTTYSVYLHGSYGNEMDGLTNITGTGRTLHAINSSTAGNEYWNGNVLNSGAAAATPAVASEDLFIQLADQVGATGQGEVDVFLTTRGIRRRLAAQYTSQKRFNDAQATKVHGGFTAIMVNEIPVVADDDCPKGLAFAVNKDALKWFEVTKPGFLETDGQIMHLKNASTAGQKQAVFQGWFRWIAALGCVAPNRTGQIRYVTDDNPS